MQRSRGHQQLRRLRGGRGPRVVHGEVCERVFRVLGEQAIDIRERESAWILKRSFLLFSSGRVQRRPPGINSEALIISSVLIMFVSFSFLNLCSCDINHDDLIGCNWWPVDWDCCYRTKTDGLVIVYSQIISNLEQLKCKFSTRSL